MTFSGFIPAMRSPATRANKKCIWCLRMDRGGTGFTLSAFCAPEKIKTRQAEAYPTKTYAAGTTMASSLFGPSPVFTVATACRVFVSMMVALLLPQLLTVAYFPSGEKPIQFGHSPVEI